MSRDKVRGSCCSFKIFSLIGFSSNQRNVWRPGELYFTNVWRWKFKSTKIRQLELAGGRAPSEQLCYTVVQDFSLGRDAPKNINAFLFSLQNIGYLASDPILRVLKMNRRLIIIIVNTTSPIYLQFWNKWLKFKSWKCQKNHYKVTDRVTPRNSKNLCRKNRT